MKFGMPALVECADIYECVKLCAESLNSFRRNRVRIPRKA